MTDLQFNAIIDLLFQIRDIARGEGGKASPPAPKEWVRGPNDEINVPQPTEIIHEPEKWRVHFGKNGPQADSPGKMLGELSQMSLAYYAAKWTPRPRRFGGDGSGLWPEDANLLNAARTLWHRQQKTLQIESIAQAPAKPDQEDAPF